MGTKLVTEVLDCSPSGLTHGERLLLVGLAEWANDGTRTCWPGQDRLMDRMQADSWAKVSRLLRGLADKGIEVRSNVASRGRQTVYVIPRLDRAAETTDLSTDSTTKTADQSHGGEANRPAHSQQIGLQKITNRSAESADPNRQEPSVNQASADVRPELRQLAERYGVATDVAQAMLGLAEQDPKITHPLGHLRNPEWEKNQQLLAEAQDQVRNVAAANNRAAKDAEAAEVLGPRPPVGTDAHYRWGIAASAFHRRHQYPGRWAEELEDSAQWRANAS